MPSDERWKGSIETKVGNMVDDLEEIKHDVKILILHKATKEGEAKALRRMAAYISLITTGGSEVALSFVKAWWASKS